MQQQKQRKKIKPAKTNLSMQKLHKKLRIFVIFCFSKRSVENKKSLKFPKALN